MSTQTTPPNPSNPATGTPATSQISYTQLLVPMPVPGAVGAPRYNGRYLNDFLKSIVLHGKNAGIDNEDSLTDWILSYSSDEVKDQIRFLPQFDVDEARKKWLDAKKVLERLYGHLDEPEAVTVDQLKQYVQASSTKPAFQSKEDLTSYYSGFIKLSSPLQKANELTEKQISNYFIDGIPESMLEWFNNQLPADNRTRDKPPSVETSYEKLEGRFKQTSLLNREWISKAELPAPRQVRFDEEGNRETAPAANVTPTRGPRRDARPATPPSRSGTSVDDLARQLEQMSLNLARYMEGKGPTQTQSTSRPQNAGQTNWCWFCGEHTSTHRPGPGRCEKTTALLADGLLVHDAPSGKYLLPDGSQLPYPPAGSVGGVAGYIRSMNPTPPSTRTTDMKGKGREQSHASTSASTNAVGVVFESYDGNATLGPECFGIESLSPGTAHPVTRTGKESNRFNPTSRPQPGAPPVTPKAAAVPPKVVATPEVSLPKTDIPVPKNPINREDGWKKSQPSRNPDSEMRDGTRRNEDRNANTEKRYRITSDMQEEVNVNGIYSRMMEKEVSVPVKELIGMSPALQKIINDATRSRREYGSSGKAAEYHHLEDPDTKVYAVGTDSSPYASMGLSFDTRDVNQVHHFMRRAAGALQPMTTPLFAMVTGVLNLKINGLTFRAMIDTGSELNISGQRVPAKSSLPLDYEGTRWSLKGIHGDPERLKGCCLDAPISIGNHDFPHHLFVSKQESLGQSFDLILGQPFLTWFAASVDYDRTGEVTLFLWKDGDRVIRPTISIAITNPSDARNQAEITTQSHHGSRVEEIPDEEDFYARGAR